MPLLIFLAHNTDVGVSHSPAVQEMDHKLRQPIIILLHIVIFPNTLMTNDHLYCVGGGEEKKRKSATPAETLWLSEVMRHMRIQYHETFSCLGIYTDSCPLIVYGLPFGGNVKDFT